MAEFDLIPPSYARGKRVHRRAKYLLVAAAAGLIVIGASWLALHTRVVLKAREVAHLQARSRLAAAGRAQQQQYRDGVRAAERKLAALHALRGWGSVRVLIEAIDAAYVDGIWVDEMRLTRQVRFAAPAARSGPAARVPSDMAYPSDVEHTAEIAGHAVDQSALGEFLRRLGRQPGISAVRLVDTGMRASADTGELDAKIALSVGDRPGGAQ